MKHVRSCILLIGLVSILLFNTLLSVNAYDEYAGVEYNDIINTGFVSYRNGVFVTEYTESGPFQCEVNSNAVNVHFVDAVLGMKVGEVKPLVTWTVESDLIEYFNVTVYKVVKDSTPNTSPVWRVFRTIIIVIAVLGGVVGITYLSVKIKGRVIVKSCSSCNNRATSKCAKCGLYYCSNCSSKGCKSCGSRQFVRIQK